MKASCYPDAFIFQKLKIFTNCLALSVSAFPFKTFFNIYVILNRFLTTCESRISHYYMIESVFIVIHKTVFSIITCSLGLRSKSTGRDLIFSREERGDELHSIYLHGCIYIHPSY